MDEAARQLTSLPWIDQVGLGLVLVFFLLGIWRGLWWQVIRLLGVVAAIALARGLSPRFTPAVEETFSFTPPVAHGVTWFVLFLGGLVVASLLGLVGKKALDAMQLGLVDRAGGALAGALTGTIMHAAALVVMTGVANPDWSQGTLDGSRSAFLLDSLSWKANLLIDAQAAERVGAPWSDTELQRESAPAGASDASGGDGY